MLPSSKMGFSAGREPARSYSVVRLRVAILLASTSGWLNALIPMMDPATAVAISQRKNSWEIATAVAGSIIGINAFNQPDVEASKIATRSLTSEYEKTGSLPSEKPFFEDSGIKLFSDEKNTGELERLATDKSVDGYFKAHLSRIK